MVAAMCANQAETGIPGLDEVRVRPVRGIKEQRRWDRLVAAHHYLGFKGFYGRALRHVAVAGGTWLGWSPAQRHARLGLVASNSRFLNGSRTSPPGSLG